MRSASLAHDDRPGDGESPLPRSAAADVRGSLRQGARFAAIALLTTVVGLLLLDRILFDTPALSAHLPSTENDESPRDKLLLAPRYRDAQVLFLGDSRVAYGFDPVVVSEACGCGQGFNAGFPSADPRLTALMADRLLGRFSPTLVVLGVSEWDLSDAATTHPRGPAGELAAPWELAQFGVSVDGPEDLEPVVGWAWRLYGYRAELRSGLEAWSSPERQKKPRRGFSPYIKRTHVREKDLEDRQAQWFTDYSTAGTRAEALKKLVADLRMRQIRVLLVAPPLYPNFHARLRREVAAFHGAISKIAAEEGAAFENATDPQLSGLSASHFKDAVHLNEDGATRFSRHTGSAVRRHFEEW